MASPKGTCTLMTFSCHIGPTSSYAARRPSTTRWWWTCTWTSLLWDMDTPLTHVMRYWCTVLVRTGFGLGWAAWVLRAYSCHTMASGWHPAMTGTTCRSGALAASYRAPGSFRDMRVTSAFVTSCVRPLVAPGGSLARRGSGHCPRRSMRLIAVATCCSCGTSGPSSNACGTSPVQTAPGGTWLAGVRSCTGHSGNCLSSLSSRFEVSAFSPHSGSACRLIFSCRLPCWPGVASLPCTLPRNQTNCFGCPLSVAPNTPCTSAPSGHSRCMAASSAGVKNGHAWGLGFGCGSGGGGAGAAFGSGLGRLSRRGFGPGLFWCWFGGRLWCAAVLKYAFCRSLPLSCSVHTLKLVCLLL